MFLLKLSMYLSCRLLMNNVQCLNQNCKYELNVHYGRFLNCLLLRGVIKYFLHHCSIAKQKVYFCCYFLSTSVES